MNTINGQPITFGGEPDLQEKTISPSTSQQTVIPDEDYDGLSKVTINAMPTATQATPSISVSSAGLITASTTQSAGYVAAGTKSATKQLTTKAATTYTPTTSNQTIASGTYLTGTQTIKGDSNLVAANIVKGKTIFGVSGSYTEMPVLLWTNASPGSSFAAQTISLNGSAYVGYLIECRYSTSTSDRTIHYRLFNNISGIAAGDPSGSTSSTYRTLSSVTSSEITFKKSEGSYNATMLPTRIWGIKSAL